MIIKTTYTIEKNIDELVKKFQNDFKDFTPAAILYFSSSNYNPQELSAKIQVAFPSVQTFGCTTAGELVNGQMLKNSVVAMAFTKSAFKNVKIEVVKNIKSENNIKSAFAEFEKFYGKKMMEIDFSKFIGLILVDGLSGAEEKLMDTIGDLTNVTFIGGSAGDDLNFKQTFVFANGKAYTDAAILALIESSAQFDIIKTQSFKAMEHTLTATKVNQEAREVIEFNNKPAMTAYSEALGMNVEEASKMFMRHPIGLMINDEPYVRSPQQTNGLALKFYCNVPNNMDLSVLKSTNIIDDTKKAVDDMNKKLNGISGIINFNCILRTLELESLKLTEEYGKIFEEIPTIGFSTYGEEYIGHINQTSTMLVFK